MISRPWRRTLLLTFSEPLDDFTNYITTMISERIRGRFFWECTSSFSLLSPLTLFLSPYNLKHQLPLTKSRTRSPGTITTLHAERTSSFSLSPFPLFLFQFTWSSSCFLIILSLSQLLSLLGPSLYEAWNSEFPSPLMTSKPNHHDNVMTTYTDAENFFRECTPNKSDSVGGIEKVGVQNRKSENSFFPICK